MFLLNSWSYHFTEATLLWHAFSRSYSINLPSSFSTAHPSALEFSSHPPVSVYGTSCISRFSWNLLPLLDLPEGSSRRTIPSVRAKLEDPSLLIICRFRNFYLIAISFPFRVHLRTGLTLIRLTLIRNPWIFGEGVFHSFYRYLYLHFLLKPLQHT